MAKRKLQITLLTQFESSIRNTNTNNIQAIKSQSYFNFISTLIINCNV